VGDGGGWLLAGALCTTGLLLGGLIGCVSSKGGCPTWLFAALALSYALAALAMTLFDKRWLLT